MADRDKPEKDPSAENVEERDLPWSQRPTVLPTAAEPAEPLDRMAGVRIPSLRPGQDFGHYRIVRLLGKGGMGEVYEAEDPTGRRLALKILAEDLASRADRERFLREGCLAASINHSNVVYVYGAEEINGILVLSIELVPGGTLKDRVCERGPMPVEQAVDSILQVIEGLQAAHAAGVLHRDIKPSNCFVDVDGTVKIGDFGLSISALDRLTGEAQLTLSGAFLGTPGFACPEQLRGGDLNVRSDIYSVGATLYYLLTGKTPFEETDLVQLIAAVLGEKPESPKKLRPEIPGGLAEAVLSFLEKDPAKRPQSYSACKQTLFPFSSQAPKTAEPGIRFIAGLMDCFALWAPGLVANIMLVVFVEVEPFLGYPLLASALASLAYFTFFEGLLGASPGKWLCSLRAVGPGGDSPGIVRAFLRSLIYLSGCLAFSIVVVWGQMEVYLLAFPGVFFFLLLPFIAARRENGFRGVHDALTATRVIAASRHGRHTLISSPRSGAQPTPVPGAVTIGPYLRIGELSKKNGDLLVLGYDPRLRRKVWIRVLPKSTPAVPDVRRDLRRYTRLRWLAGRRLADECWDAYEAPEGRALLDMLAEKQEWINVRRWLLDLAEELHASTRESPVALGLDRVWITHNRPAKLLDFSAPHQAADPGQTGLLSDSTEFSAVQSFLWRVAFSALQGHLPEGPQREFAMPAVLLPIHARSFLKRLRSEKFQSCESVVAALRAIADRETVVLPRKRFSQIVCCCLLPLLITIALPIFLGIHFLFTFRYSEYLELEPLYQCAWRLVLLERQPSESGWRVQELEPLKVYIAGHFSEVILNPSTWELYRNRAGLGKLELQKLELMEAATKRVLEEKRQPSAEDIARASATLQPFLLELERGTKPPFWTSAPREILYMFAGTLAFVSLVTPLIALAFSLESSRGRRRVGRIVRYRTYEGNSGPLMMAFGIGLVRKDGTPASPLLAFWRNVLAWWSPWCLVLAFAYVVDPEVGLNLFGYRFGGSESLGAAYYLTVLAFFVFGSFWSILSPQRGFQDQIAGTCMVPR